VQVGLLLGDAAEAAVPMGRVIARELEVLGSHGMPSRDYPGLLALVASGDRSAAAGGSGDRAGWCWCGDGGDFGNAVVGVG
jgi:hypothetical protein